MSVDVTLLKATKRFVSKYLNEASVHWAQSYRPVGNVAIHLQGGIDKGCEQR